MKSAIYTSMHRLNNPALWPASLLALLLMLAAGPGAAAVRATLDRDTVYAGDTLTLTIESDGLQSGQQPDLTPLEKDFDILGTGTSTQVSIINGRRSDKTLWQVQLQPRHTGRVRIPPLSVGGEQTAALELDVTEAPQQTTAQPGRHVFIEAEISSTGKPAYVQQQIPYTVRLYYDDHVQEGKLIAPEPENAVVEQLGEDKSYSTVRNGQPYNVIERHYVISPEKSGALHIPPATFRGRVAVPQQRGRGRRPGSLMDEFFGNSPFANDPFFRDNLFNSPLFGSQASKPVAARSQAVTLDVRPRPATAARNWLPAEAVTLDDSWTENPPQLRAGEPVTRTITIQTRGLSGSQIPELTIPAPANARVYPEATEQESRTDGTTIYGIRSQTLTYIPDAQGTLDVPAVTLNWWDTRHDKAASTTLPAWQFKVLPGAGGSASETPAPPRQPEPADEQSKPVSEAQQTETEHEPFGVIREYRYGVAAGGGLLLALLGVLLARRAQRRRRTNETDTAGQTSTTTHNAAVPQRKTALRDLEKACSANDPHAAAKALLELGHAHWPDAPPRSLEALAARIKSAQALLRELDRSLYAADAGDWNGTALWEAFRHGIPEGKPAKARRDDGLNPLYPQHS